MKGAYIRGDNEDTIQRRLELDSVEFGMMDELCDVVFVNRVFAKTVEDIVRYIRGKESKGLESTFRSFIFGVITAGFYRYAIAQPDGNLAPDQYETVLVIEEANEVLTGSDTAGTSNSNMGLSGQSEFEQILDQSAGYGLFVFAITQKIADMPKSIIANSGIKFIGKIVTEDDINVAVKTIARDPRFDDRDVAKWFPRSPTGWFVCQSTRTFNFTDIEPVLVKIAMLNSTKPSNSEIDEILAERDARLALKESKISA